MTELHGEYVGFLSEDIVVKIAAFLDLDSCCRLRVNKGFRELVEKCVFNKMSHVHGNQIFSSAGFSSLVAHFAGVNSIALQLCPWLDDTHLASLATHCACLRTADFRSCQKITDAGIAALAAGCRRLQSVDLTFCSKTTYWSVLHLLDACGPEVIVRAMSARARRRSAQTPAPPAAARAARGI